MSSIIFPDLKIFNAEQFKESIGEPSPNTNIYLTIGKIDAWANDASPNTPITTQNTKLDLWHNMIGGKALIGGEIQHVIPKFQWVSGNVYTAYDHTNPNLLNGNTQFYVINYNKDVYKCISNNYGALSNSEPTSIITDGTFQTSDGYIWKYMYSVSEADQSRFLTTYYIPVKTLTADDGSLQWQVQENAIKGGIHNIDIVSSNSNFTNANSVVITITGDGSGATAIGNINTISNTISSIVITNPGINYTTAAVAISGGTATARAIISPENGHGSDPLYELGGYNLVVYSKLQFDENEKLPTTNEYRQVAIIKDPYIRGTSNIMSNSAFSQFNVISTNGAGDYNQDEFVYQGSSIVNSTFRARVLRWDSANGVVYTINNMGNISTDVLVGANSLTTRFVSAIELGELEPNTGRIFYLNNIIPITRSYDQQEIFQIILKF